MLALEEAVGKALSYYGEALLTNEGKIDCFKRFGYTVWEVARDRYIFNQQEHIVPEKMLKKWEKEKAAMEGIATQDTILTW